MTDKIDHRQRRRFAAGAAAVGLSALLLAGCAAPFSSDDDAGADRTTSGDVQTPDLQPLAGQASSSSSGSAPSASDGATASPKSSTTATSKESTQTGSAIAAVQALPGKGRAPKTGYDRAEFGSGWIDVNRNGCDTRNDMLRVELTQTEMAGSCKVLSGWLADPYTGKDVKFVRGGASEVDIDHVVALGDAWQKGAQSWPYAKRVAFANDPLNLQPSDASANRQKGDGDAATWLPANKEHRCEYVATQAAVKVKYDLWVTQAEKDAMLRVLSACPDQELPGPGSQPTMASNTGGPAPSHKASTPAATTPPSNGKTDPRFGTCGEAAEAGFGPYLAGKDAEYEWYQDRDKDGSVCE